MEFTTSIPRNRFEPATPVPLSAKRAGAETELNIRIVTSSWCRRISKVGPRLHCVVTKCTGITCGTLRLVVLVWNT